MTYALVERIGDSGQVSISVIPQGSDRVKTLSITMERYLGDKEISSPLDELGLTLYRPEIAAVIAQLVPGKAAERDGLAVNDRVLSANGVQGSPLGEWVDVIRANPETPIDIEVDRAGEVVQLTVTPNRVQGEGVHGSDWRAGRFGALSARDVSSSAVFTDREHWKSF